MPEAYNVFISWSGPRSKQAAEALKKWLPTIIQAAQPWMSASDIDKGTKWGEEVFAALDTMGAGIICLTPGNLSAEWLLFEAGALSKTRDRQTRVWTYLLGGLKPEDLEPPLAMFQATTAEKEDTRQLIHTINKNLDASVPERTLNLLFDKIWPDLEKELAALPEEPDAAIPKRSADDMVAEALTLLRSVAPKIEEIAAEVSRAREKERSLKQGRGYEAALSVLSGMGSLGDLRGDPSAVRRNTPLSGGSAHYRVKEGDAIPGPGAVIAPAPKKPNSSITPPPGPKSSLTPPPDTRKK